MVKAYVLIVSESGKEDLIISSLKNIPSITTAFGTFGSYDILVKLESSSEQNIQNDISNAIRKIPNIRATHTLLVDKNPGIIKINKIERQVLDTYMAHAFMTVHCLKSDESKVIELLENIPEVIEIDRLLGHFEIICKITAPTYTDISEIIGKQIRKISEIKSTITINVINNQGFDK